MASDRTEEPTPRRLRAARRKGEVARSRDLATAAVLLASAAAIVATHERALAYVRATFTSALDAVARPEATAAAPFAVLEASFTCGVLAIAPLVLTAFLAAFAISFLQVGPLLTVDPVLPKLSRLDASRGLARLFAPDQLVELAKSALKLVLVAAVAFVLVRDELRGVLGLVARQPAAALDVSSTLLGTLLLRVGGVMAALGAADYFHRWWKHRRDQRMTKDEVKREHKESEGDASTKQERERLHRELLAQATLEQVRRADVLVVNPTHLAIALRYDEEAGDDAPEVLAKGQDELARRMIDAAREAGVPVMRDVPLARALYELAEGDAIPESLYDVVAIVLRAAWDERVQEESGSRHGGEGASRGTP